jgi:hypothetical protein
MKANTKVLGLFWGIIKINTSSNPHITIKELFKEREVYQYLALKCGGVFCWGVSGGF